MINAAQRDMQGGPTDCRAYRDHYYCTAIHPRLFSKPLDQKRDFVVNFRGRAAGELSQQFRKRFAHGCRAIFSALPFMD